MLAKCVNRSLLRRWPLLLALTAVTACSDDSSQTLCYWVQKDNQQVALGIPAALVPWREQRKEGNRFILNIGVNLKDFSPASVNAGSDENVLKVDWSVEKYGWNPSLTFSSAGPTLPQLGEVLAGKLRELPSDLPGFRRFEECAGCGIEIYVQQDHPEAKSLHCYVPSSPGDRGTGCMVYEQYGSGGLSYIIPYTTRTDLRAVGDYISSLFTAFEKAGRDHCTHQ